MHPLDRPVWASLSGPQRALSVGDERARRYAPGVNVFASARDDGPDALAALADLITPAAPAYIAQVAAIVVPPGCTVLKSAVGVQMVAARPQPVITREPDIVALDEADAAEMLALAQLTEPGPYLPRTHTMGSFIGIRIDGRLAAMAGERMRPEGYVEVSGVCTHPDFRGRGLARRLSAAVAATIEARGATPFLHAWRSNTVAIALYESLGFVQRSELQVAVIARTSDRGQPTLR